LAHGFSPWFADPLLVGLWQGRINMEGCGRGRLKCHGSQETEGQQKGLVTR
jgi:hypothetical protein